MAEAFVKTLKRDYARVNPRPDAASVLRQLDGWFEHYNTIHRHKALGYRSPREFRNLVQATGRVEADPHMDVERVAHAIVYMPPCRSTPMSSS